MSQRKGGFDPEIAKEAAKRGNLKSMADVLGMPTDEDETLLRQLIQTYEQKTGGLLARCIREAREDFGAGSKGSVFNEFAIVNKDSRMMYDFELPESFVNVVEKHWPTIFTDKEHYHWFKRKLPGLMIRPHK